MKLILSEAKLGGPAIERRIYRFFKEIWEAKKQVLQSLIKTSGFWREMVKIKWCEQGLVSTSGARGLRPNGLR